ncbi:MAG TPA: hypothetical protein VJU59_45095 [Paraburkholderia sp.]|uniref:hypothetical protein n=1 Tax=Paraburkholderia TaxID=1822464 RepID=UPI001CB5F54B|nr:hypothetical protein [Paraburkholderia sp.]CAG9191527.1 conserved exported hypothetical protein [Paraburkholderia sabiae]HKR46768.1 hypothetical protein [Paraburkholderia sp.]
MLTAALFLLLLSACGKSQPTYSGISTKGMNYLPYNLDRFTITDQFGNKAGGGGDLIPGSGSGSLACCYKLKGTEFTVRWKYYDADDWRPGEQVKMREAEAKVSMPPSHEPDAVGARILELHFYPDQHVELVFPGKLLGSARLPFGAVSDEMSKRFGAQLDARYQDTDAQSYRRIARIIAAAWLKYRLTDARDLETYAYYALLVNPRFDEHPSVQKIIQEKRGTQGGFATAMTGAPRSLLDELKANHFQAVSVPAIPAGTLPPTREENGHAS